MSDALRLAAPGLAGLLSALQPRVDPPEPAPPPPDLVAIHDAGWQQGFVDGEAAATAALAPLRIDLGRAAAALDAACHVDVDRLRPLFVSLIEQIAKAVLMAETAASSVLLLPLVEAALAAVRPDELATLRAHPDTLAALQPHLPIVATAPDADLALDEFAVTGPTFIIETGLLSRLAQIVGGLA